MKALRILMAVAVCATGLVLLSVQSTPPAAAAECINVSGNGDKNPFLVGPLTLTAGTTLTVTLTTGESSDINPSTIAPQAVPSAPTLIIIVVDGQGVVYDSQSQSPHTVRYTMPSDSSEVKIGFLWTINSPANTYTVTAGCDLGCSAYIPEQAVGGQFVDNAEIYWAPGKPISPAMIIEAGKTYLVAGQDATGMYRKVLLTCEWVWVRAETVGPNFDAVWNGAPLPTTVVD